MFSRFHNEIREFEKLWCIVISIGFLAKLSIQISEKVDVLSCWKTTCVLSSGVIPRAGIFECPPTRVRSQNNDFKNAEQSSNSLPQLDCKDIIQNSCILIQSVSSPFL